jgi:hypothetical protein
MVFHMLRRQLGDDAFWGALKDLYRQRLFKTTSWTEIQKAFEARGRQSLDDFFNQWVNQTGAPRFYLDAVKSRPVGDSWEIKGRIVQQSPPFSFDLDLTLESQGQTESTTLRITGPVTPFQMVSQSMPKRLIADPEHHLLRRLFPVEIPPAINAIKSSASVVVLLSADLAPQVKSAAHTLILSLGLKNYTIAQENTISREQLTDRDLVMIGYPRNKALLRNLPGQITIDPKSFRLNQNTYERSSDAFFGVFAHPFSEARIAALFYPLSSQRAEDVARKITHYGKYSYLAFENGQIRAKGVWPIEQSPVEHRW